MSEASGGATPLSVGYFTWDDVDRIRTEADRRATDAIASRDAGGDSSADRAEEDVVALRSIADRIVALLPPREEGEG